MPVFSMPVSSSQKLADKLKADWEWVSDAYKHTFSGTEKAFKENVTKTRSTVQSAVLSASDMRSNAEVSISMLTEPSPKSVTLKNRFLEFRRDYKQFLVAGVAFASIIPAVSPALRGSAGSKLEAARMALRNLVLGGGSATVLFYPEAVFAVAPAFSGVMRRVEEQVVLSKGAQELKRRMSSSVSPSK